MKDLKFPINFTFHVATLSNDFSVENLNFQN